MPATIRCTTPTVDGASVSDSRFTHAYTSLGRMSTSGQRLESA